SGRRRNLLAIVAANPEVGAIIVQDSTQEPDMPAAATLHRTDVQLLAELQRHRRLSNADLAERVHLSPSACLRRVQRLERSGVIAGYRAELDPERLGLGLAAFVRIRLNHHDA